MLSINREQNRVIKFMTLVIGSVEEAVSSPGFPIDTWEGVNVNIPSLDDVNDLAEECDSGSRIAKCPHGGLYVPFSYVWMRQRVLRN